MASESLFKKCKKCGKDISKTAKSCPQCGDKKKKMTVFHWVGVVLLGSVLIGTLDPLEGQTSSPTEGDLEASPTHINERSVAAQSQEEQRRFVKIASYYAEKFRNSKNELQESRVREQRREAIASNLYSRSISSWVGKISQLETNTVGKAILSVQIAPDVDIQTWNNAFSDLAANTLIEKDSQVYNSLIDLSNGQYVKFSGSFLSSERDFVKEASVTIRGSLTNPEFLFKFSSVEKVNHGVR